MGTEATHEQGQMQNEPQALLQKKAAGKHGVQVQEARDMVREEWVDPLKWRQEKIASAKHRAGKQEGKAV